MVVKSVADSERHCCDTVGKAYSVALITALFFGTEGLDTYYNQLYILQLTLT